MRGKRTLRAPSCKNSARYSMKICSRAPSRTLSDRAGAGKAARRPTGPRAIKQDDTVTDVFEGAVRHLSPPRPSPRSPICDQRRSRLFVCLRFWLRRRMAGWRSDRSRATVAKGCIRVAAPGSAECFLTPRPYGVASSPSGSDGPTRGLSLRRLCHGDGLEPQEAADRGVSVLRQAARDRGDSLRADRKRFRSLAFQHPPGDLE